MRGSLRLQRRTLRETQTKARVGAPPSRAGRKLQTSKDLRDDSLRKETATGAAASLAVADSASEVGFWRVRVEELQRNMRLKEALAEALAEKNAVLTQQARRGGKGSEISGGFV